MATRESIEFDFKQALAQAEKIENIADNLKILSNNRFGATMQNLSANWKGENASGYLNKGGRLQDKMNVTANDLHNVAADIRKIAKSLYDAEIAALEIASTREY